MKSYSILVFILFHAVEWLEKHRWDLAERLLLLFFLFIFSVLCIWIYKSVGGFQLSQHSTVEMSKLKELLMSFSMNMKCQANKIEIGGTGIIACVFVDVCVCVSEEKKKLFFFLLFIRSFGNIFFTSKVIFNHRRWCSRLWMMSISDILHEKDHSSIHEMFFLLCSIHSLYFIYFALIIIINLAVIFNVDSSNSWRYNNIR